MLNYLILLIFLPIFSLLAQENKRFEAIQPILNLYERPITLLAIGENPSEICTSVLKHYSAICVVADEKSLAESHKQSKIIHLKKNLSLNDLRDLNKREHFDVILAFHALEKEKDWKQYEFELFKLCDNLVIEALPENAPEAKENPSIFTIAKHLTNMGLAESIGPIDNCHLLWYCFKPKSVRKDLYINEKQKGISLQTFYKHSGCSPSKKLLREQRETVSIARRYLKSSVRMDGEKLY